VKQANMSPEIAQQVVFGITAVGVVVWLLSLNFLVKSARLLQLAKQEGFSEPPAQNLLTGSAEVEGDPKALAAKAAAILAKGTLGPLKIVDKTDDRIVFERPDPGIANQPAGRWFRRGELRFMGLRQNRTQVEWAVEPAAFQWMLEVGSIVQIVGLVGLIVGCWAMSTYVATSPEPAVRWQSLQMLQVVHVLWPPFLFSGLYRRGIRGVTAEFEALANNLPYLGD
jgi:hypothetical protein